jgi:hypothetical protein
VVDVSHKPFAEACICNFRNAMLNRLWGEHRIAASFRAGLVFQGVEILSDCDLAYLKPLTVRPLSCPRSLELTIFPRRSSIVGGDGFYSAACGFDRSSRAELIICCARSFLLFGRTNVVIAERIDSGVPALRRGAY